MSPAGRLDEPAYAEVERRLAPVDAALRRHYPGPARGRQPVHTVYVPADRYTPGLPWQWGRAALATLAAHPPAPFPARLTERVARKLATEPIEDLRVDFEDGYGAREDAEEDAAALTVAAGLGRGSGTPYCGIRIKSLEPATRRRALRTLDLFLAGLAASAGPAGSAGCVPTGAVPATGPDPAGVTAAGPGSGVDAGMGGAVLPAGFVVTLPKVSAVEQVEAMVLLCGRLERAYRLAPGALRFEVQVETPAAVLGPDGAATVARMVHAARGRCAGLHYGTYDYSAACGVAAGWQGLEHPVADHARAVMQVAAAGTGVPVCDGSTNVLPVGDTGAVQAAWRLHSRVVRRALVRGFYQGWDLHPAQLPTRYAATYEFFRSGASTAVQRLTGYLARRSGGVLDEPATARALAGFLLRGLDCGALDPTEVPIERSILEAQ